MLKTIERSRKALESQINQMQARLDQAESGSVKDSKRIIQSLEQRVIISLYINITIKTF